MRIYIINPKSASDASTTMTGSRLCKTIANDCFFTLLPHSEACIAAFLTFKAITLRMFHVCVKNDTESILSVSERIALNRVMIQE